MTCDVPVARQHLRSVYGHFLEHGGPVERGGAWAAAAPLEIRISDVRASSGEVRVDVGDRTHRVRWHDVPGDAADPLVRLEEIVLAAVSGGTGRRHLVRALAVSWRQRGIVLLGLSRGERSGLGVELAARGLGLLSDSVACFDLGRGFLEAFPRQPAAAVHPQPAVDGRELAVAEALVLGPAAACTPGLFLFCQGFGEATRIHPVSAGRAVFRLLRYSYGRCPDPAAVLFDLGRIVDGATCLEVVAGEAHDPGTLVSGLIQDAVKP
jgi:hypothetical protein